MSICNHNAIVFKEDVEGFKYPMIEEGKCINCGLCEMACPILYRKVLVVVLLQLLQDL